MTQQMIPREQQARQFNGPLRGTKSFMTEGGLRVPCIIEWPDVITSPRSSIMPCVTSDILPTLLDLLDIVKRMEVELSQWLQSVEQSLTGDDYQK